MTLYWAPKGLDLNRWSKNPSDAHLYPGTGCTGVPEGNSGLPADDAEAEGIAYSTESTETEDDEIKNGKGEVLHIKFDDMTIWR